MSVSRVLRLAWLCLALFSVPLLSSCGGASGGVPAGIGAALINAKLNANVATLNIASGSTYTFNGSISGLGEDTSGTPTRSFELVLKGAGVQGNDVSFKYNLEQNVVVDGNGFVTSEQHFDGSPLYQAKNAGNTAILGPDGNALIVYQDPAATGPFYYATTITQDSSGNSLPANQVIDAGTLVPVSVGLNQAKTIASQLPVFRYLSDTAQPMLNSGKFDVEVNFYTVTKDLQQSPSRGGIPTPPFWRVLFPSQSTVQAGTIYLSPLSSGDPTLNFSKQANINMTVNNLPPGTQAVKVVVGEQPLNNNASSSAQYQTIAPIAQPFTGGSTAIVVPVVNRLRPFDKIEAQAFLDSSAVTVPVASGRSSQATSSPLVIGVTDTSVTAAPFGVTSRVSNLAANDLVFTWPGSGSVPNQSFLVTATFAQNLPDIEPPAGPQTIPNSELTFGTPAAPITGAGGTYGLDTSGVPTASTQNLQISIQGDNTQAAQTVSPSIIVQLSVSSTTTTVTWGNAWIVTPWPKSFVAKLTAGSKHFASDPVNGADSAQVPVDFSASQSFTPTTYAYTELNGSGLALASGSGTALTLTAATPGGYSTDFVGSGTDYVTNIPQISVNGDVIIAGGTSVKKLERNTTYPVQYFINLSGGPTPGSNQLVNGDVFTFTSLSPNLSFDGSGNLQVGAVPDSSTVTTLHFTVTYTPVNGAAATAKTFNVKIDSDNGSGNGTIN